MKTLAPYLTRDAVPNWGKMKAADVTKRQVIGLVEAKADETPIAGRMLLGTIKSLYIWANEVDILTVNPAATVKPPARIASVNDSSAMPISSTFWQKPPNRQDGARDSKRITADPSHRPTSW